MARWRHLYETEVAEFNRRDELGVLRDAGTFAWRGDLSTEPFDVLFVLPMMGVFGGVADVLELTNALILEGLHAGVVLLEEVASEIGLELFFTPLRLPAARFPEGLPETRVLVATAYQTAPPVALAAARRPGMKTAYFLQDYEGWFGGDPVEVVAQTYDLVPRMTAISTWLADEIAERHGHRAAVVPMSGDPEVFYPRGDRAESGPIRVVAMLRYEERRGFRFLLPALSRRRARIPASRSSSSAPTASRRRTSRTHTPASSPATAWPGSSRPRTSSSTPRSSRVSVWWGSRRWPPAPPAC